MHTIATALHELLNAQTLDLSEVISRHFTDDYRQRTDGTWSDRAGFTEHIAHLRSIVEHAEIDVLDELDSGTAYAERHIVTVRKSDGSEVVQEVYVFAELAADGRFSRIEEVTLMLSGDESDRAIGSAR